VTQVAITAAAPLKITGRGNFIAMNQNGCVVTFHSDDVVAIFDAVASVMADNKRFTDAHEKHRHRKGKHREQEQQGDEHAETVKAS
jgi:hypothetical protein